MKVFMSFVPDAMIRPSNRWGRARENDWLFNAQVIPLVSAPPWWLGCAVAGELRRISIFFIGLTPCSAVESPNLAGRSLSRFA
jgi:hypothetical protein